MSSGAWKRGQAFDATGAGSDPHVVKNTFWPLVEPSWRASLRRSVNQGSACRDRSRALPSSLGRPEGDSRLQHPFRIRNNDGC